MALKNHNAETIIKIDFESPEGIARLLYNESKNTIKNNIIKYSPISIILELEVFKESGLSAILLNIERLLIKLFEKSFNIKPVASLTNFLKAHLHSGDTLIIGEPPNQELFPELLKATIQYLRSQITQKQNLVILLEFNEEHFAKEFLDFIAPIINNMPNGLKIYSFIKTNTSKEKILSFDFSAEYYWNYPSELGLDLHFLAHTQKYSLVEFLTTEEISILLRLWSLSEIAIPAFEAALKSISSYQPLELMLLIQREELGVKINNKDRHHAEYKLYRELAFHYAKSNRINKAQKCQIKALNSIEKSSLSDIEATKLKGDILAESAQFAKSEKKLTIAIHKLRSQRLLYEQYKNKFKNEISANAYNLGTCYRENGNYTEAIRELNYSAQIEHNLGHKDNEIETRLELGRTYIDLNDINSALNSFIQVEKLLPASPEGRILYIKGIVNAYLCHLRLHFGEKQNALAHFEVADQIFSILGAEKDKTKLHDLLND